MKKTLAAAALLLITPLYGADSRRTAEYLLVAPESHEGKDVTVDVSFVKPVRWVSPLPEVAFFHAMTIDRQDYKPGGAILVAVPKANAESFAKRYGLDFEGRGDSDQLKGTFIAAGRPFKGSRRHIWLIDTTGSLPTLIKERNVLLPEEVEVLPPMRKAGPGKP